MSSPKQDRWMACMRAKLEAPVLIAVGAAFDFHSGTVRQAPRWMQRSGLEWVYRLATDPGRRWRRYLVDNPLVPVGTRAAEDRDQEVRAGMSGRHQAGPPYMELSPIWPKPRHEVWFRQLIRVSQLVLTESLLEFRRGVNESRLDRPLTQAEVVKLQMEVGHQARPRGEVDVELAGGPGREKCDRHRVGEVGV